MGKRTTFLAAAIFLATTLWGARAFAEAPSCNPEVMKILKNREATARIQSQANGSEVVKRNEPTAGLTCLDKQLKLTADLGKIFSDKKVAFGGSTRNFCGLGLGGNASAASTLSKHISVVVGPSLNNILGNFLGGFLSRLNLTSIREFIADLEREECIPPFNLPPLGIPSFHLPGPLGACLPGFEGLGITDAASFGGRCFRLTLPTPPDPCDNIKKLWKNRGPHGNGVISIEGGGINKNAPYSSFRDLIFAQIEDAKLADWETNTSQTQNTKSKLGGMGKQAKGIFSNPKAMKASALKTLENAGEDFKKKLLANKPALDKAWEDLKTLSKPGNLSSWPETPELPDDASPDVVIDAM